MSHAQDDVPRNAKRGSWLGSKWIWLTLVAAVPAILGGVWYSGKSAIDAKLAALTAEGLPTTAGELNAFYAVPHDVDDASGLWVEAVLGVRAASVGKQGQDLPLVGDGLLPIPDPGEEWADLEASRNFLGELGEELTAIRDAAAAEGGVRFPVDFSPGIATLLPHAQDLRQAVRLMLLDAHVSAHSGNHSQALEDIQAIFACSDALRLEPLLISQLVRIANHQVGVEAVQRLMPHCNWSESELESLQMAIGAADFKDGIRTAFYGERAIFFTTMDSFTLGPFRQSNNLEAIRFFEGYINSLSQPWPVALDRHNELKNELTELGRDNFTKIRLMGVLLLLPAMDAVGIAGARATARQRCANAAIATQRHQLKHGDWPDSLANVEQQFFGSSAQQAEQLIDPFNGEPLRYKVEETRVMIYSVGENKQDDGGEFNVDDPQQLLDIGFSLKK
jgi:hypothetical protein